MQTKHLSQAILGLSIIVIAMMMFVSPVFACSPAEGAFDYTLAEQIDEADFVLIGTVIGGHVRNAGSEYVTIETAQVEVTQYLKGNGNASMEIRGFGDGADCNSMVQIDGEYIFFVDEMEDGRYRASYMAVHDATLSPSEGNIEEIVAITGGSSDPQPDSLMTQLANQLGLLGNSMIMIGIGIMVGGVFAVQQIARSRGKRKSKAKRG